MKKLLLLLSALTLLCCNEAEEECEEERQQRIDNILEQIEREQDPRKREALRDIILEEQNKDCG